MYLSAVARLKQIFEIKSPEFEPALLAVVRKHCQGGKAPTLKKGNRRCRQTYKDLSTRPMYKEVFGGIVKVFKIKDAPRFYKDVGDVLAAFCELPETKIIEIKLEEMGGGNMPDMKGRVFKIEIDPLFRVVDTIRRKYKIKWLDVDKSDPNENFLKNYDEMWRYMEHPPGPYGKEKLNQFFLGDFDYRVNKALSVDKTPPALGKRTQHRRSRKSETKIMEIKLEEIGMENIMKGRVFKIEIDPQFRDKDTKYESNTIKQRYYKIKWLDLDKKDPNVNFLKNFDEMWHDKPKGPFYLGDADYRVHFNKRRSP